MKKYFVGVVFVSSLAASLVGHARSEGSVQVKLSAFESAIVQIPQNNKTYLVTCAINKPMGAIPGMATQPTLIAVRAGGRKTFDETGARAFCMATADEDHCTNVTINKDGSADFAVSTSTLRPGNVTGGELTATVVVAGGAQNTSGQNYSINTDYGDRLSVYVRQHAEGMSETSGTVHLSPWTVKNTQKYVAGINPKMKGDGTTLCVDGIVFTGAPLKDGKMGGNIVLYAADTPVVAFSMEQPQKQTGKTYQQETKGN